MFNIFIQNYDTYISFAMKLMLGEVVNLQKVNLPKSKLAKKH
jgi:hypothetical protein